MYFTNVEYADIIWVYAQSNGNAAEARREYARRFPNRRLPNRKVFLNAFQSLRDTGAVPGVMRRAERVERNERRVLRAVEDCPQVSVRRLSSRLGVSRMTVWRTFNRAGLHPYHFQRVQHLQDGDHAQRVEFCTWIADHPRLCKNILFTDEAIFTRSGYYNSHNFHWWSEENPKKTVKRHFQHRFSVNVWCGVIDSCLIGPFVFEGRLTGEVYVNFLRNELPLLLEEVPLMHRRRMIYQQDGAPPHFSKQVMDHLNQEFPGRWVGRGGPIRWPARSPDLTPLDFYLWGHLKDVVYNSKVNSREELIQKIQGAALAIKENQESLRKATQSVLVRARKCIEVDGGHFEHLL